MHFMLYLKAKVDALFLYKNSDKKKLNKGTHYLFKIKSRLKYFVNNKEAYNLLLNWCIIN